MHNQIFIPFLLTVSASTSIGNEYVQYGFLGILLSILIWYSRSSYKENLRRELKEEAEKSKLIERYENQLEKERDRYHDLHMELIALFKFYKSKS